MLSFSCTVPLFKPRQRLVGLFLHLPVGISGIFKTMLERASVSNIEGHQMGETLYTGIAYVFTVTVLILPYLLLSNVLIALAAVRAGKDVYLEIA